MTNLYLGVDGGGTGCRARIEDANGKVLGVGVAGPATTRLGVQAAWSAVDAAASAAFANAGLEKGDCMHIKAGFALAGLGRKGSREKLAALPHRYASVAFTTDAYGAFLGAHSGNEGAVVIAGTGSVGIGYANGRQLRVGGYGFPISDEGSGAFMGLRAVQLALRAHDKRRDLTPLLQEVMGRFDNDPFETVDWMDSASASEYAAMAPLVMRRAEVGDEAGILIVQQAARHIESYVVCLKSMGARRISLVGGLSGPVLPWLADDVRADLSPAQGDAVSGAVILAKNYGASTNSQNLTSF